MVLSTSRVYRRTAAPGAYRLTRRTQRDSHSGLNRWPITQTRKVRGDDVLVWIRALATSPSSVPHRRQHWKMLYRIRLINASCFYLTVQQKAASGLSRPLVLRNVVDGGP